MDKTLLILAAGMGSRYGGLKQIEAVRPSGEAIMDFSIFDAIRAGITKIVFVIRHDIEKEFIEKIGSKYENIIKIEYAFQEIDSLLPKNFKKPAERKKAWGTGHAILVAKDLINEPFIVINADDFYGKSGYELLSKYFDSNSSDDNYAMVGFVLKNTLSDHGYVSRGVCDYNERNSLLDVTERTHIEKIDDKIKYCEGNKEEELTGNEIVSMNMWGFNPSIFKYLEEGFVDFLDNLEDSVKSEFYIPSLVDNLIKKNIASVTTLISKDTWLGITYPDDKPSVVNKLNELIDKKIYPSSLNKQNKKG